MRPPFRLPDTRRPHAGVPYGAEGADGGLKRNPSAHAHYSIYYDEPTRRIVDEYMGADLAAFGYTFESEPPKPAESTK